MAAWYGTAGLREGLLVAGCATFLVGTTLLDGRALDGGLAPLVAVSLAVSLPLPLRRRLPLTAAMLSSGVSIYGSTIPGWTGWLVAVATLGAAVYHRPVRLPVLLAVSLVWVFGYGMITERATSVSGTAYLLVIAAAPLAVGYALRLHRERTEQVLRLRYAEADRAAAEDRARLAREVHDSVGHHLTAIRMQATSARRSLGGTPPTADRVLGTISELSSSALTEVRELLDTMRAVPESPPGMAELEHLVDRMSTAERRISLHTDDPATPPPPAVDHACYRVIQEALTNAVRHAEASEIDVSVRWTRRDVHVTVTDNGVGRPDHGPPAEGHGLRSMEERVRSLGGTVVVGPHRPHGWSVRASLPLGRSGE